MKIDMNKFALAAAIAVTVMKAVKMIVWKMLLCGMPMFGGSMCKSWHMHKATFAGKCPMRATCPIGGFVFKLMVVFAFTFATAWLFAWLYKKLTKKK